MPLIPSQQSSLKGTRTALTPRAGMAAVEVWSLGPSKKPQPCWHAYSAPLRLTPRNTTTLPLSTRWLPTTERVEVAAVALASCPDREVARATTVRTTAQAAMSRGRKESSLSSRFVAVLSRIVGQAPHDSAFRPDSGSADLTAS